MSEKCCVNLYNLIILNNILIKQKRKYITMDQCQVFRMILMFDIKGIEWKLLEVTDRQYLSSEKYFDMSERAMLI